MTSSFRISIDRRCKLLRVDFRGFLCLEDVSAYLKSKEAALARLGCAPNDHVTLCDFSASIPQSQEVLALFKTSLEDPASMSRRLAVVVGSALTRMQAQRIVTRENAACFTDEQQAKAWLLGDGPA